MKTFKIRSIVTVRRKSGAKLYGFPNDKLALRFMKEIKKLSSTVEVAISKASNKRLPILVKR